LIAGQPTTPELRADADANDARLALEPGDVADVLREGRAVVVDGQELRREPQHSDVGFGGLLVPVREEIPDER
jgi:hypothetical protein